jgi:hypothetical protein
MFYYIQEYYKWLTSWKDGVRKDECTTKPTELIQAIEETPNIAPIDDGKPKPEFSTCYEYNKSKN